MRLLLLACALPFLGLSAAVAAETASFLKIIPGARPIAMGGAFTGIADDLNSLSVNPAGLSRMPTRQASFMHAELFAGTRYDSLAFGQPAFGGAIGIGLQRLSQATIEGRDADRRETGGFTASDMAFGAAYSKRFPVATFGAQIKLIESRIADATARTTALDLGVQRGMSVRGLPLSLGAAVRNLGPGLKFESETNQLPTAVSVGTGLRLAGALLLAADVSHRPYDDRYSFGLGTEYALLPALSVRTGYASASQSGSGAASGLTGLGLGFGLKIYRGQLDYAFAPAGELGNAQRLGFTARF